jgi:hypothetical protein
MNQFSSLLTRGQIYLRFFLFNCKKIRKRSESSFSFLPPVLLSFVPTPGKLFCQQSFQPDLKKNK